ncbi:MAG: hypothetical protein KAI79_18595 [Bacteroidales bacterium]|nr:hypothetical protein [Bacteroidales bacterium]
MTKEKFTQKWDGKNDQERIQFLIKRKNKTPEFRVEVDNDDVSVIFIADENEDTISLSFNEFGYHLLVESFQAIGINADYC